MKTPGPPIGGQHLRWNPLNRRFGRLGLKLSLLSMALITLLTVGTAFLVIDIMDDFLFREMVKRGSALAVNTATPAGYSLLAEDLLGLDHLVSKIEESQSDVLYVAIVDPQGRLLVHSRLKEMGEIIPPPSGKLLAQEQVVSVRSGLREGKASFEFDAPIHFQGREFGRVQLGIDATALTATKQLARRKIFIVSVIFLLSGTIATLFLTQIVTRPVARLSEGVASLKSGEYNSPIVAVSHDELGDLTRNFNDMAAELLAQKESLDHYVVTLNESYLATLKILSASIDARDQYTLGHSQRVSQLSVLIGRKLGMDEAELKDLEIACLLHDIGKIRVPDRILQKDGALNDAELTLMSQHPQHGADILGLAASMQQFIPAAISHHERYDGRGYPQGLKGEEIPLFAAIVAIADCFDAMTTSRPYRAGLDNSVARAEIQRCRGTQFSPKLVDLFLEAQEESAGQEMDITVKSICA
ncbi:MAG: HD domain-containing protein [Desulfuromonadales bacterium]|nr:HD domain-containing protein [Desulfuromonadales bacterium]